MSTAENYNTNVKRVKALLREHPDGLTTMQLCELTGIAYTSIHNACHRVRGIYWDRWTVNDRGNAWVRVYCLGNELDAPKPEIRVGQYRRGSFAALGAR